MNWQRRISFIAIAATLLFCSCADRRPFEMPPPREVNSSLPETVTAVADVFFGESVLQVFQMIIRGTSLIMTGKPIAFARWDVGVDPENPQETFTAGLNINGFAPVETNGPFLVDSQARNAMTTLLNDPNTVITSGELGVSVIDASQANQAREIQRYPRFNFDTGPVRDEAFTYTAMTPHPSLPNILFGFRQQDFAYTLTTNGGVLQLAAKDRYAPNNICCVEAAVTFAGKIYVAMRNSMWIFPVNGSRLASPTVFDGLQVVGLYASERYLYAVHEPTLASVSARYPRGIYIFDAQGNFIAHLPISPIVFAVFNDTHIYANMDDQSVRIFRILWQNIGDGTGAL